MVSREELGGIAWYYQSLGHGPTQYQKVTWGLERDFRHAPYDYNQDGTDDFIVSRATSDGVIQTYIRYSDTQSDVITFGEDCDLIMVGKFRANEGPTIGAYRRATNQFFSLGPDGARLEFTLDAGSSFIVRPDGDVAPPEDGEICYDLFACDVTMDFVDTPFAGALWKPVSENTGRPVFLLPAEYWDSPTMGIQTIDVLDAGGNLVANGSQRGCCPNGNRAHYDVPLTATALLPYAPLTIRLKLNSGVNECRTVPVPTTRYD